MSATIVTSTVAGGSNSHATTATEANAFATDFVGQGIVGSIANTLGVAPATGGFAVNAQGTPAMFVDVSAGAAYITATPSGAASQSVRAYMSAAYTSYAISANASGSTKYDWIYLKVSATAAANPDAAADDVTSLFTSRSSSNTADNGSPPTYGIPLAIVTVANGASSITNANIKDNRSQATPSAQLSVTGTGWTSSSAPTSVSALGNRSYSVVTNSTDLTGTISKGMRLKLTRTVAAPTQCTSLNGTTQYYSKTSPSGSIGTVTDDITCMAWIKLSSYPTSVGNIISKRNATNGFTFRVEANTGAIAIVGLGTAGAYRGFVSYQSVPLNKWVHVSASLDMSGNTTTTNKIFFDGIEVPVSAYIGSGAVTAFIQGGNLDIGVSQTSVAATEFFPGKIAQAAVFNGNASTITQSVIQGYISQGLSGSETSNIGTWTFNNSLNDSTANANNLTASGSAVATNADSPFAGGDSVGLTEYGIVTAAAYSSNTTLTVQVPEGYAIPTSGGVSAVAYSTHKVPYGFPTQKGKWAISSIYVGRTAVVQTTAGTYYFANNQIILPIGEWSGGYYGAILNTHAGTTFLLSIISLSTANNAVGPQEFVSRTYASSASITEFDSYVSLSSNLSLATQTTYYIVSNPLNNAQTIFFGNSATIGAPFVINFELSLL